MEEQIVKRYVEYLVGSVKIAREFGLQKHQVLAILKKHGIKARKTRRPDLSTEEMIRLYDEEGLNTWQIAERMKTDQTTVRKRIKKSGRILEKSSDQSSRRRREKNVRWSGYEDISGQYWGNLIRSAKKRGILFDITHKQVFELFKKQDAKCAISGKEICLAANSQDLTTGCQTASLDRIDSSKGYLGDNIQWVHKQINGSKMDLDMEIFLTMCKMVSDANR